MVLICITGLQSAGKQTLSQIIQQLNPQNNDLMQLQSQSQLSSQEIKKLISNYYTRNIVIYPVLDKQLYDKLNQRNLAILIKLECPIKLRYLNYCKKTAKNISLEQFIQHDDALQYESDTSESFIELINRANLVITNNKDIQQLQKQVFNKREFIERQFRPNWDLYFMKIANIVKNRSNCMKKRVGCVIVKDKRIISTGYNGTPQGLTNCYENGCERCNSNQPQGVGLDKCFCLHAEFSALIDAGINLQNDFTCYTTLYPCMFCSTKLIGAGAKTIVYQDDYNQNATKQMIESAGISLYKVDAKNYHF